jgi:hypothetical protein
MAATMHKGWKIIALALGILMLSSCAKKKEEVKTLPLSDAEVSRYSVYMLSLPEGWQEDTEFDVLEYVLKDSVPYSYTDLDGRLRDAEPGTPAGYREIPGISEVRYTAGSVPEYLYNFGELVEVAVKNGFVYINYYTADGMEVIAAYRGDGFYSIAIYDGEAREFISLSTNTNVKYTTAED